MLLLLLPLHRPISPALRPLVLLPGPATLGGWAFWDSVVQKPDGLQHEQLKSAAKALHLPVRSIGATGSLILDMASSHAFMIQAIVHLAA
jgi:hypothetical protein